MPSAWWFRYLAVTLGINAGRLSNGSSFLERCRRIVYTYTRTSKPARERLARQVLKAGFCHSIGNFACHGEQAYEQDKRLHYIGGGWLQFVRSAYNFPGYKYHLLLAAMLITSLDHFHGSRWTQWRIETAGDRTYRLKVPPGLGTVVVDRLHQPAR
jgi:hypothetical protein